MGTRTICGSGSFRARVPAMSVDLTAYSVPGRPRSIDLHYGSLTDDGDEQQGGRPLSLGLTALRACAAGHLRAAHSGSRGESSWSNIAT